MNIFRLSRLGIEWSLAVACGAALGYNLIYVTAHWSQIIGLWADLWRVVQ